MEEMYLKDEEKELLQERYELALGRIKEIALQPECEEKFCGYFSKTAEFLLFMDSTWKLVEDGTLKQMSMEELQKLNHALYEDVLTENYERSYTNPTYTVACFGKKTGQELAFVCAEMRGMIGPAFEQRLFDMVIRMELFLEVYSAFTEQSEKIDLTQTLYWYVSDYFEQEWEEKTRQLVDPDFDFATRIIMDSDLNDLRYLYYFGEYITENELRTASHLNEMPMEKIKLMADTYTEGYRIGFEVGNKDISIKKTVGIYYNLGFERMLREAIHNFEKIGLRPALFRGGSNIFQGRSVNKNGFIGANPNKQFDYDHKEDQALVLNKQLVERKLESAHHVYESLKEKMTVYGGPAVIEIFGEKPFVPQVKTEACKYSDKQQKLSVEYAAKAGALMNEYIKGEERSFTIIAFPIPEIGDLYEEIFDEIVKINTLDYKQYQKIQQTLIDALDQGVTVRVKGKGKNRTDLQICLHTLQNPQKETNFENCVSDVNIPVGEVFTSPVLKGTNGVLHVTRVFLNQLEFKDIAITFEDGMIADYSCSNFETEEENKKYIKDNVLFHHDTLPIGEFAIGTNTTAYVVARKYGIEDKLPILIAEKTGPHFAVGDTCYSHAESVQVFNPDGKEIIAKDNEVSMLRDTDVNKAYFQCHTDITIPYDELGEVTVLAESGNEICIIQDGIFVLPGCEELNKVLG